MKTIVILNIAVLLFGYALCVKYTDCGSATGKILSVAVQNCDTDDPCILKRGTNVGFSVNFQSNTDSKSSKAVVHGIIAGVPVPFRLPNPDGCTKSGLSCPLENSKTYTYTQNLDVKNSYPPLDVTVKWELKDENSKDLFCLELPAKVQ